MLACWLLECEVVQTMAYYSYNVYFNSNIVPPMVISAICVVIAFLPMALLFLARGDGNKRKKIKTFCLSGTSSAISYVFKDAIQKVEERKKSNSCYSTG